MKTKRTAWLKTARPENAQKHPRRSPDDSISSEYGCIGFVVLFQHSRSRPVRESSTPCPVKANCSRVSMLQHSVRVRLAEPSASRPRATHETGIIIPPNTSRDSHCECTDSPTSVTAPACSRIFFSLGVPYS